MNENAHAWVAALESDEYEQGQGCLHDVRTDKFCCLGIACDLAVKAGVIDPPAEHGLSYRYENTAAYLPKPVARWLGIIHANGLYSSEGRREALRDDNDAGKTFAEIAAIIRSEPEGLFES